MRFDEDPNERLSTAIMCRDFNRVKKWLNKGADPNYCFGRSNALIICAIFYNSPPIVSLLLEKGAEINMMVIEPGKISDSPLHGGISSVRPENHEVLDILVIHDFEKGYNLFKTQKNSYGSTPYDRIMDKSLRIHYDDLLCKLEQDKCELEQQKQELERQKQEAEKDKLSSCLKQNGFTTCVNENTSPSPSPSVAKNHTDFCSWFRHGVLFSRQKEKKSPVTQDVELSRSTLSTK